MDAIDFPKTVLQSFNFAPLDRDGNDKPLRLKNVATFMEWYPEAGKPEHYTVALTLGEAETLRCLIRDRNKCEREALVTPLSMNIAIAVLFSPSDVVIEATLKYDEAPFEYRTLTLTLALALSYLTLAPIECPSSG